MTYRGDGEASPERLRALDHEIAALEARLTDVFWEHVAPVWGAGRGLSAALGALEARHARIAELTALIARVESGPSAEPDLPPPRSPPSGVLAAVGRALTAPPAEIVDGLHAAVRRHAPEAVLAHRGGGRWGVRFAAEGAPIDVCLCYEANRSNSTYFVAEAETTVAPSARLEVKPEGILQDLLDAIGVWAELELGDSAFDPAFVVRGDEATARAFLTAAVRRALLAIGEEATLEVSIARGRARLSSRATSRRAIALVIDVLAAWHALPSPHPLLREPAATARAGT